MPGRHRVEIKRTLELTDSFPDLHLDLVVVSIDQ